MEKVNNILLAGTNGFIGAFLYGKLNSIYLTTGLDYGQESIAEEYYSVDLSDLAAVRDFVDNSPRFDALIFLVGLAHKKGKGQEIDEFRRINKQTLVNLLSSLGEKNKLPKKIIFASTISVYGEKLHQNVYKEDSDKNPFSPYALTKLEAEEYLLECYPTQSWILRFAPVYSSDFLLNIHRRTRIGSRPYKVGKGAKKLSLCNIENIMTTVEGIVDGIVPAGVYNISDSITYSYNDLLNYQGAATAFRIPVLAIRLLYFIGRITKNIFLKENSIKLIADNIFPSDKIQKYIKLNSTISDLKILND